MQTSNRYVIIRHMIHPCFTLLLPFVTHVCTCRPLSRHLNLLQQFSHDSRLIYTFGKLILVKLVTLHCNLSYAICTINGNLKLSTDSQNTPQKYIYDNHSWTTHLAASSAAGAPWVLRAESALSSMAAAGWCQKARGTGHSLMMHPLPAALSDVGAR